MTNQPSNSPKRFHLKPNTKPAQQAETSPKNGSTPLSQPIGEKTATDSPLKPPASQANSSVTPSSPPSKTPPTTPSKTPPPQQPSTTSGLTNFLSGLNNIFIFLLLILGLFVIGLTPIPPRINSYEGELKALGDKKQEIFPPTLPANIKERYVNVNSYVKKGELLVELEFPTLDEEIEREEEKLKEQELSLENKKNELDNLKGSQQEQLANVLIVEDSLNKLRLDLAFASELREIEKRLKKEIKVLEATIPKYESEIQLAKRSIFKIKQEFRRYDQLEKNVKKEARANNDALIAGQRLEENPHDENDRRYPYGIANGVIKRSEVKELENKQDSFENEIRKAEAEIDSLKKEMVVKEAEMREMKEKYNENYKKEIRGREDNLKREQNTLKTANITLETGQKNMANFQIQIQRTKNKIDQLNKEKETQSKLKAPFAGFISLPSSEQNQAADISNQELSPNKRFKEGEAIYIIESREQLQAILKYQEHYRDIIKIGQKITLKFEGTKGLEREKKIEKKDFSDKTDQKSGKKFVIVRVTLDNKNGELDSNMSVSATIEAEKVPLYRWMYWELQRIFSFL